ncbi:MAG TPA: ChbG/HpnK family deacetylase [Bordetella sp.]|uniref:ChbG/HpnK family deacetylase n=1 Tax=Bordetella sp. TaxID=28081 RepID=UPI002ED4074E
MNRAVDAGILDLARAGRLGAVSCMSLGPSFPEHAAALREMDVDAGLHFDLTEGVGGQEPAVALKTLIGWAYTGRLVPSWVNGHLERQLDAFERIYDAAPAYLDGHQHVHQLPGVLPRVIEIMQRRYGARMPWLRCTLPRSQPGVGLANVFKAQVIGALGGHALRRAVRRHGWRSNERFLGVYGLSGGAEHYAQLLGRWFDAAQDGDLMMCHPAHAVAPGEGDALMQQRAAEFEVLSSEDMPRWLSASGLWVERLSRIMPLPAP